MREIVLSDIKPLKATIIKIVKSTGHQHICRQFDPENQTENPEIDSRHLKCLCLIKMALSIGREKWIIQ